MAAVLAYGKLDLDGEEDDRARPVLERWSAAVSHRTAAEVWGLLEPHRGSAHVAIADRSGRKRRTGIVLHRPRSLLPSHVSSHEGIPVTTPARTIADLERAARRRRSTGRIPARELRRAIRQADVIGLPLGSGEPPDRTRSDLERDFLRLCRTHRLPPPDVNVRVDSMLVDFLWRQRRLVVETDGYRYHRGRAAFEDDRRRDLRLRALGYDVIRLSGRQVADAPEEVAAVLRVALAAAP
jgi:very-short-patch-repair endonuclease